jgi:hypothetical protein
MARQVILIVGPAFLVGLFTVALGTEVLEDLLTIAFRQTRDVVEFKRPARGADRTPMEARMLSFELRMLSFELFENSYFCITLGGDAPEGPTVET